MSRDRTQASNHFWAAPHRPPLHTPLQNLLQHRRSALSSAQPEPPSRTRPVHRPIIIPHADEGECASCRWSLQDAARKALLACTWYKRVDAHAVVGM
eukprot:3597958-Rhodomonas_salina.1